MGVGRGNIHEIMSAQSGTIARWQAVLCGFTPSRVKTKLTNGEWVEVLPGVYRLTAYPVCTEGHIRAASLWAGKGAILAGAASVWWWGMTDREPTTIDLLIPPSRNLRSNDLVRVSRRGLPAEDHATYRQVRVVAKPFAALFGSVSMGVVGQQVLDRALLRTVRLNEVQRVLARNKGARGALQAARWLAAASDGTAAESERLFARLLRAAGITGWHVNRLRRFPGGPLMPDFRFDALRIVVEIDGWAFHTDPEAFDGDRSRQNRISIGGWSVLRFTWFQLHEQPEWVVDQVRAMISSATGDTRSG